MEVGKTVKKKVKLGNKKLGLDLVGPSDANEGSGVFIAGVTEKSAAAKGELNVGERLITINGIDVEYASKPRVLGELNRLSAVKTLELTVVFDPVGYAQYDQGALLQEHPEAIKEKEFSVFEYNLNPVVGDDHTDHAVFDARANFEQGLSRTAVTNNATGMNVKVLDEELAMIQQAAEEKRVAAWKDSGENFVTAFNNAEDNESKKKQRQTMGPKKAAKFKKRLGSFKTAEGEKGKLGDTS